MKNKILTALLFLSILVSGCSSDNPPSTNTTTPPPQTSTEPKTSTAADNGEPLTQEPEQETKKISDTDGTSDGNQDDTKKQPDAEETSSKVNNTGENPDDTQDKKEPNSEGVIEENTTPPDKPDNTPAKTDTDSADKKNSPEPIPMPSPQKPESFFDGIDMFTAGIIVVLVAVLAILIWLVYDRNKMRRKINNLNNSPSTPNPAPQNVSPPPQTPATVTTTAPTASPPPVNKLLSIRVDNLQHIGSRQEQQDSFCLSNIGDKKAIREKGLMAVVADGMGGLEGGAIISRLVTDTFLNSYNDQFNFEPASFLYNTAESAEFTVEDYIKQSGVNGGSTLVAVIIKNSQMNYISVGDSHIYLLRDNTLTMINKEHSFGALLKEKADRGEVDPREPYVNPKRNSLTAYIGMGSFNIVDRNANPISLKGGDKILLCSDGVYNALGDDALIAALAGDASNAAKKIQAAILEQNIPSQDNFTAIILECVSD